MRTFKSLRIVHTETMFLFFFYFTKHKRLLHNRIATQITLHFVLQYALKTLFSVTMGLFCKRHF